MSAVAELVRQPAARPPFDIVRVAYVELRVRDLAASEDFYAGRLGMVVAGCSDDAVYLRGWEERMHPSLVLRRGAEPAVARIGFLVAEEADLESLAAAFAERGLAHEWAEAPEPELGRVLRAWDPFGYP